jgi:hypothetical protein
MARKDPVAAETTLISCKPNLLLPVRVLSKLFRRSRIIVS